MFTLSTCALATDRDIVVKTISCHIVAELIARQSHEATEATQVLRVNQQGFEQQAAHGGDPAAAASAQTAAAI